MRFHDLLMTEQDTYLDVGHRVGASSVYYIMPGGKLDVHPYEGYSDMHGNLGVTDEREMQAIAAGRIDHAKKRISMRETRGRERKGWRGYGRNELQFIAGILRRAYPDYEIVYYGRDGPAIVEAVDTNSPQFARWFAGSKVVDAKGRPLKMFHGTNADFMHFHSGSHFGTARAANQRVRDRRRQPPHDTTARLIPVYLRITKPLRVDDLEASDEAALLNAIARGKYPNLDVGVARREGAYKAAQDAGYDGLVYNNHIEDRGKISYVIFDPAQVKSAISD